MQHGAKHGQHPLDSKGLPNDVTGQLMVAIHNVILKIWMLHVKGGPQNEKKKCVAVQCPAHHLLSLGGFESPYCSTLNMQAHMGNLVLVWPVGHTLGTTKNCSSCLRAGHGVAVFIWRHC